MENPLKKLKALKNLKALDNLLSSISTLAEGDVKNITIRAGNGFASGGQHLASASGDIKLDFTIRDGVSLNLDLHGVQIIMDD